MLQTIDNFGEDTLVFVVDLVYPPALPITWSTLVEKPYAEALQHALENGKITRPGKYGIGLDPCVDPTVTIAYSIYAINE
jgi:hypothetical protein